MKMIDLNCGSGIVRPEAQTDICLPRTLVMIGGAPSFFNEVFRGVHAVNRRSPSDQGYIAITFPEYQPEGKGLKSWGNTLRLVGSEAILAAALNDDRIAKILPKQKSVTVPYTAPVGNQFAAFRDREREKQSIGRIRRRIRRAERNGKPTGSLHAQYNDLMHTPPPSQERILHLDMVRHDLRIRIAPVFNVQNDRLEVTTYGLSTIDCPVPFSAISQAIDTIENDPYARYLDG